LGDISGIYIATFKAKEVAMKSSLIYIAMTLTALNAPAAFASEIDPPECLIYASHPQCKAEKLNIFVGPQSVEPGNLLYIAIEAVNTNGSSANADTVIITDNISGKSYEAAFKHGLAHIEVTAPSQAGRLTFTAQLGEIKSKPAEVLVNAAVPTDYKLFLEKDRNNIFVNSSLLTDRFGNLIEHGQIANVRTISKGVILASQTAATQNSRINIRLDCADLQYGDLYLEADIRGIKSSINIPNYMCGRKS
jgi:hypothetical protein